jgi:hypothetical protein
MIKKGHFGDQIDDYNRRAAPVDPEAFRGEI